MRADKRQESGEPSPYLEETSNELIFGERVGTGEKRPARIMRSYETGVKPRRGVSGLFFRLRPKTSTTDDTDKS